MSGPVVPRYREACVSGLLPAATAAVAGDEQTLLPLPGGIRAVVVLVVDGLGRRLLDRHAEVAPFLAAAPGPTVDAPFPTTTATSLTSIGTGRPPGEHGIVGFSLAVPHDDRALVALTWSWCRQDLGLDARADVVPEELQPHPTALESARARGVRAVAVLRPEFRTSGLTRAGLRGGEVVAAAGLDATLDAAVAATAGTAPTVVYAHHGDVDAVGHITGPSSEPWLEQLQLVDAALQRTIATLPSDVAVVVTADHGMVHVPPAGFVELDDRPELLAGVRVLTGDGRARQLHTTPGATADVLAAWRESTGGRACVRSREEAIAAGWFGPVVADRVRPLIGDVVVVATVPDVAWVHREQDLLGGRMPGLHGALTREELEVPALVLTGGEG